MTGDPDKTSSKDGVHVTDPVSSVDVVAEAGRRGNHSLRDIYVIILTLGVMYFMICAGYGTFESLQSTINVEGGLGTTAIGTLYASAIVSSLLLAPTIVAKLGPRLTLCIGWAVQALFAVANSFPRWETLVPVSAGVGTMFAATSIVYGVYVTTLAEQTITRRSQLLAADNESTERNEKSYQKTDASRSLPPSTSNFRRVDNAVVLINSILLAFINAGSITGSMIGSLVVGSSTELPQRHQSSGVDCLSRLANASTTHDVQSNTSTIGVISCLVTGNSSRCGTNHCPFVAEHVAAFAPSDHRLVYIVGVVSFTFNVIALFITVVLLRPPPGAPTPSWSCDDCRRTRRRDGQRRSATSGSGRSTSSSTMFRSVVDDDVSGRTSKVLLSVDDYNNLHGRVQIDAGLPLGCDDVTDVVDDGTATRTMTVRQRIRATFRLLTDHRLQLLIPSVVLMGVVLSFSVGAFNQSFVGCLLGVQFIGYSTLCFRGALITCSLLTGQLVSCINRRTIILIAKLVLVANISTWFIPLPHPSSPSSPWSSRVLVPVVVLTWCAANGAVYGLLRAAVFGLFPRLFRRDLNFALAHANIWESFGSALAFFVNDWFCFDVKAYALVALTAVSAATYITLECIICDVDDSVTNSFGEIIIVDPGQKKNALGEIESGNPFMSVALLNDLHGDHDIMTSRAERTVR